MDLNINSLAKNDQIRVKAMIEGGKILGWVRLELIKAVKAGVSFNQLEKLAQELIKSKKALPSFSTVPGYHWATCLMANDALCHGIPSAYVIKPGDVITIDVGLIWQGYHVDSTMTVAVEPIAKKTVKFLELGRKALYNAINQVSSRSSVYDLSTQMEQTARTGGASVVSQLTGHGIGEKLHMPPNIPCVANPKDQKILLRAGQTIAVEIMYCQGKPDLVVDRDGWTYRSADGSLTAMFEETVLVGNNQPFVLTQPSINELVAQ